MDEILKFKNFNQIELDEILKSRKAITFIIDIQDLKLDEEGTFDDSNFNADFKLELLADENIITHILLENDKEYLKFLLKVNQKGGEILYEKFNNSELIATLKFQ